MKVVKFGGSSLASSQQLYKVLNIIKSDYTRRFVVVSAPGKRYEEDLTVKILLKTKLGLSIVIKKLLVICL